MGLIKFWVSSGGSAYSGASFRFAVCFSLFAISLFAISLPLAAQTELGSEDDLTILGANGSQTDPDVEIKGFSVFGATQSAPALWIPAAPGNIFVNGYVQVSSGMYVAGSSTFTAGLYVTDISSFAAGPGSIYIKDGAAGQVLKKVAGGGMVWGNDDAGVSGTGTQYRIPMWNSDTVLTNSVMNQDGGLNSITLLASSMTIQGSAFSVGGSTLVVKDGNVGIGTTKPGAKLHAVETSGSNSYIFIASTATDSASYKVVVSTAGSVGIGITDPTGLFQVGGGTMTALLNGRVGIGTVNPGAINHIQAAVPNTYTMVVSTGAAASQYIISVSSIGVTDIKNLVIENRTSDPPT
ncbi:MAG: hypothetical protein HY746_09035 [Elusimicrobia bacterium]|nr:hypothetical protein [Elusimicrobiota bacterium]